MKDEIIITLALLAIGLGIRPWRFRNSAKPKIKIFEIFGWIFLLAGTLMLLSAITGTGFKIGYYFGIFAGLLFIFSILNTLVNWLKKLFGKN